MRYVIGIDEAGRGPLAGPVAVGAFMAREDFDIRAVFPNARDSKVLSEKKREEIFKEVQERAAVGEILFSVQFSSSTYIDTYGIVPAVNSALARALKTLAQDDASYEILLDGGLKAPAKFISQRTIIRGDATEPLISLASIVAKVRRDHLMLRLAKRFPQYGFEQHKGYGTLAHRQAIFKNGLCEIHRATFCARLVHAVTLASSADDDD